jgi:4-hydroxy-tetrahydrodipicolinate synthase
MDIRNLKGSIVALVTPFHADGSVNFGKLRELVEWHIENKTDALLALGTTGESATMSHEEDNAVLRCVIETAGGRVPVIAGTGSNSTETMLEKSLRAQEAGADGLLLITPYYNKGNAEGICRHFATVADAVNIPCILYNVPGRTGCAISVENVERLSKHPNICGIKEASGDMSYAMKIAHCIGPDFALWSGNDDITLPLLSIGGSGVISVWANVMPRECHDMVMDYLEGRQEQARAAAVKYLALMNGLFMEVNPIPVKTALNLMGKEAGPFRLPLCEMSEANEARLRELMEKAGLPV